MKDLGLETPAIANYTTGEVMGHSSDRLVCMYVCMYACMHACMYVPMHLCILYMCWSFSIFSKYSSDKVQFVVNHRTSNSSSSSSSSRSNNTTSVVLCHVTKFDDS